MKYYIGLSFLSLMWLVVSAAHSAKDHQKFLVSFKRTGSSRAHHRILHSIDPSIKVMDQIQVSNFHAYVVEGKSETMDQIAARDDVEKVYPNKKVVAYGEQLGAVWGLMVSP